MQPWAVEFQSEQRGLSKPDQINPAVQACIKAPLNKRTPSEIQDRLVLLMLNEAARCLEEKVVTDPEQLDLAMIFGTGFPPFLGGILKYADSASIDVVYDKLDYLSRVVGDRYVPANLLKQFHEQRCSFYSLTKVNDRQLSLSVG
jgi:3-hydroxyacyl-CoA dehydrogenase / enoyl-CoA hydratase / 3-hydroxybutyryl-CoA epimerase